MIKFQGFSKDGKFIDGLDKAVDGLNMIMGHRKKTRAYDYNFGNDLEKLIFEPIKQDMENDIEEMIINIVSQERRFRLVNNSIEIELDPDNTLIKIAFEVYYKGARVDIVYYRGQAD